MGRFRAKTGWWWNVELRIFSKNFLLQNSFLSGVDYISTVFYFGSYGGGWGESSHFSEIFDFLLISEILHGVTTLYGGNVTFSDF